MNFQDDIAQFVQDRGRVRMGQVSWWWASPSTVDLGNINLLDTAKCQSEIADGCEDLATKF